MARTISQIQQSLQNSLIAYAASIGITIDPAIWATIPGDLSETDYKVLLLNTVASAMGFEEQLNDLFIQQNETLIKSAPPQIAAWFQLQMLNFQFNSTTPQIPTLQLSTTGTELAIVWNPIVVSYRVISFCAVTFSSDGVCRIKVAAISGGIPADLDTIAGAGALSAAKSFVNLIAAPGISYVVTSGKSDWLFLQIDLYYNGLYSSTIFQSVSDAITAFLNNLSVTSLTNNSSANMKLSALEQAILAVTGVDTMAFINVAARPDIAFPGSTATTWGTSLQSYLVLSETENYPNWQTKAGYLATENGGSTGGSIPNSKLNDFRVGSSGVLNLNCIPV